MKTARNDESSQKLKPVAFNLGLQSMAPHRPWNDREICVQTWAVLRREFPKVFAAVLMPDHLHVAPPFGDPGEVRAKFARVQGELTRLVGGKIWKTTSPPEPVQNLKHLTRLIRYLHLNPCRDSLCSDPIEWEWSTHRDYLGAVVDPWVQSDRILSSLGFVGPNRFRTFHAYVSGDPSVSIRGTPAPIVRSGGYFFGLDELEVAAAIALRTSSDAFRFKGKSRALLLRSLSGEFLNSKAELARFFGVHRSALSFSGTVGKMDSLPESRLAQAIRVLLSDPRLMREHINPK